QSDFDHRRGKFLRRPVVDEASHPGVLLLVMRSQNCSVIFATTLRPVLFFAHRRTTRVFRSTRNPEFASIPNLLFARRCFFLSHAAWSCAAGAIALRMSCSNVGGEYGLEIKFTPSS